MKIALIGDSLTEGRPGVSFFNMLKEKYPTLQFINLGKSGETVNSLYNRLLKKELEGDYDISFLWIGVNDVYSKLLSVQAQPVAKDLDEFNSYYKKVLQLLLKSSKQVVLVTPAIVGEKINNSSNKEIKEINQVIELIAKKYDNVKFLDIHTVFENYLSSVSTSDYISIKVWRVMGDVFLYKKPLKIEKISNQRGLHLTLDGVHLNNTGAKVVADAYASAIESFIS